MVESQLHIALKRAVQRHLAGGSRCWFEVNVNGRMREGILRADVCYTRNLRDYYVECETSPSVKRLREKGKKRVEYPRKIVFILLVTEIEYLRHDWGELRGLFDKVYAYSVEEDRFTRCLDLRTLGWLQDLVLDTVTPIYRSRRFTNLVWFFLRRRNLLAGFLGDRWSCLRCCMGQGRSSLLCTGETCRAYTLLQGDREPPEQRTQRRRRLGSPR